MRGHCFASALLALLASAAATAQQAMPSTEPLATIKTNTDAAMRMTVPVTVNGRGPFNFVVDTGADRTVISTDIATALGLKLSGTVTMHSMSGISTIGTVRLGQVSLAGLTTSNIAAPALMKEHIGAQGLLGLDTLKQRRVVIDFEKNRMSILAPGEREPSDPDTIVVTARSRFGQLILVDADVDGTAITVIIDTGSETTIGNAMLRQLLAKRQRKLEFFATSLMDVTGKIVPAEFASVGKIRIAGLTVNEPVIAFADVHPFVRYGLMKKPAMLLGMDTLRGFRRVSVDFGQRKVRFLPPGSTGL